VPISHTTPAMATTTATMAPTWMNRFIACLLPVVVPLRWTSID
jgi:hypothetical protein